jgi:NitT/TauT family transport system ATP-binding protein
VARRVSLARAIAVEPDFLVLDEPLASLDEALAARLRNQIVTLLEGRATTTLLVTHNLDDAVRLGDRLFLLSSRPATILHALPIRLPRSARSEADIGEIRNELARLNHANK